MSFSFLEQGNLIAQYKDAESKFKVNFEKFDEFERIASNLPKQNSRNQKYPSVTDGTTAAYLTSRPKAIVQTIPTGRVNIKDHEDSEELVNLILSNEIIPHAKTNGSILRKSWAMVKKAMIYGSQPSLSFVRDGIDYYGADFSIPYIKDVILEPGKLTDFDANYCYLNAWYKPGDIKAIIAKELKLVKDAKKDGEKYTPTWDLKLLEKILTDVQPKPDTFKNKEERSTSQNENGFIRLIHCFQKGKGADFFTINPEASEENSILRKWTNPDPRGLMPIDYMYYDMDLTNPLGESAIAMSAPMQDMLDSHMQAFQFMTGLTLAPPLKIKGNIDSMDLSRFRYEPNSIWPMGNSDGDVIPMNPSASMINGFPNIYGLLKSQILNLTNTGDTSISSESGNPGFSKTPAGVQAQQSRVDIADNHLRKQFEDWFERVCETMLNLHVVAHTGSEAVKLSQDFIKSKKVTDPTYDKTEEVIDYESLQDVAIKFEVDASSSQIENNQNQLEILKDLWAKRIEVGESLEPFLKLAPLTRRLIKKTGLEDPEEVSPEDYEVESGQQEQMAQENQQPEVMPEEESVPQELSQQDTSQPLTGQEELIQQLRANGLNDKQIELALINLSKGVAPESLDQQLKGVR